MTITNTLTQKQQDTIASLIKGEIYEAQVNEAIREILGNRTDVIISYVNYKNTILVQYQGRNALQDEEYRIEDINESFFEKFLYMIPLRFSNTAWGQ